MRITGEGVAAYYRARKALSVNSIEEYERGIRHETGEFLKLNQAVADAEAGCPRWLEAVIDWQVLRELHYWDRFDAVTGVELTRAMRRVLTAFLAVECLAVPEISWVAGISQRRAAKAVNVLLEHGWACGERQPDGGWFRWVYALTEHGEECALSVLGLAGEDMTAEPLPAGEVE